MRRMLVISIGFALLFSGCAHVSDYGFIDQKLKHIAISNSIKTDKKMGDVSKALKSRNVALTFNGIVDKEQGEYVKSIIEKYLTNNDVNICSLDKADYILNIRVDVLGTIQDDEHFGIFYHTSKRIGQTRVNLSLSDIKSKKILNEDTLQGCAMWTELYLFWIFGPIRNYNDNVDYKEYRPKYKNSDEIEDLYFK
ncbi:MAG: hypothetical protein A2452_12170 [Candidatus Firestonebacteria bacterium RIFOXYC2_FULL_39_67]|nr:MAG: hypothetical protein A2536_07700 [Candidatus Firestonebacteria bacterium RIFOXYD2_FULL_39_29]OGF55604.1 MAG: hypothetical protein A2452_12170 [Candidatus Firestonebacteria bacterium RIFOXYC2_FULL_39_67]